MAGVFKSLDKSDVRITPFRTFKLWYDNASYCNYTASSALTDPGVIQVDTLSGSALLDYVYTTNLTTFEINKALITDDYTVTDTVSLTANYNSPYGPSVVKAQANRSANEFAAGGFDGVNTYFELYNNALTQTLGYTLTAQISNVSDVSYFNGSVDQYYAIAGSGSNSLIIIKNYATEYVASTSIPGNHYPAKVSCEGYGNTTYISSVWIRQTANFLTGSQFRIGVFYDFGGDNWTNIALSTASITLTSTASVVSHECVGFNNSYLHYTLFSNGELYTSEYKSPGPLVHTKLRDDVAYVLRDSSVVDGDTYPSTDPNNHVVLRAGIILTNYSLLTGGYNDTIDFRQWMGSNRNILKATINQNKGGLIGILVGNTDDLRETIFFTINPITKVISDPIHMGATKADLKIEGRNLETFLGFGSQYNERFVDFLCETSPVFSLYKADYNPVPSYLEASPLQVNFDQGNPHYQYYEQRTANDKFERIVHRSIDHLYYRNYYDNTRASFGGGNINYQYRYLEDQAYVISLPQSKFGESILQGSVKIKAQLTTSGSGTQDLTIVDDLYGNLYVSGAYTSEYGLLLSSSVSKSLVGEWPFDTLYKYVNKGPIISTSSFNRGNWVMQSEYNNVEFKFVTGGAYPLPKASDLIGVIPRFTASLSSSITIRPNEVREYKQSFNFENGDFSIAMLIRPEQTPLDSSGSILITKEGVGEDLRTDQNGNVYTIPASNRSPYRLIYTSESKVLFERDTNTAKLAITSSVLNTNTLYHIAVVKTGSLVTLYLDGSAIATGSDTLKSSECSNQGNVYIGNNYTHTQGFNGYIDTIKMYNQPLTSADVVTLYNTMNVGNAFVGNVYYTNGMIVLSSIAARFMDIQSVQCRGTHTIWETEISCTIGPGEFGMSSNPTLQEYNPSSNQYEYRPFVTSSYFRPYITTIGLYNDFHQLVALAKLNTPIQTPTNTDTTFIVRFDR